MVTTTSKWQVFIVMLLLSSAFAPLLSVSSIEGAEDVRDAAVIPWPMFGKDARHTGLEPVVEKGLMDPYELWDRNLLDCLGSTIGNYRP